MTSAILSRGLTPLSVTPHVCAAPWGSWKCPVAVHRFDQQGKKFESSPALPSSKLESTRMNRVVKFQPPSLSTHAAAAAALTIEQGCATNPTQSWEEYFRTLIDESEDRSDTESLAETRQIVSTERNGSTGDGMSSLGSVSKQENLESAIQALLGVGILGGVQKAVEEVSVRRVTSNVKQLHNTTAIVVREIDLSTRWSSYCIRMGAHNLKLDQMTNRLMDVALRATVGRGLELDLHIFRTLGSMHLELYAGSNRYAIIPCAFEILPLALLDGLTDKAAEQPLSALSSGATAARQSTHALHIGAAGVLGEASCHDTEGCELQYLVCDTLPWQYVANQAWMG